MDLLGAGTLLLVIALAGLVLSSWQQMHRRGKMPPGPTPLPLIGNLLWIDQNNLPNSLIKLSKKYRLVYMLQLGPRRIMVLCGYEAIKEALVDQANEFWDWGLHGTFDWIFQGHEKIHEEIDRVVGVNQTPRMEDRLQMPYTEAMIHEIQRFGDIVPLGLPRRVTRDVQLRGYTIPKGTEIFPMLGTAMRDPKHFARPEEFDPQHFLDQKGQFQKNEAFIPFSTGKRYCFGEHLARAELFLFLTSILQHFRFKSAVPPEDIDLSPMLVGFATIPQFYEFSVILR
ncbi:cytochrome P450 2A5-like [Pituophis catenifer annectens]|uniref:cytochrome P450 2A5-like n=1 Tax=Pituophis catenifer annectens TaxID=94852 RepID=UPI003996AA5A